MKSRRTRIRHIREGRYLAEVVVDLMEYNDACSPYLSVEDAYRLDDVRTALRDRDFEAASRIGKVYTLTPVDV